ncbi:MAG: hypothetical protein RMM98_08410 [Acidobacteriota bacterium]|nr:hypothetical protein [Blastocatellia bacterium]MDW8239624.1 hypothetical protein [Acidobacteriota bacterium]
MSVWRLRLAIFLMSLAVIGLELALMRVLSLRYWYYFASMVISVALLGFGASGTALTLWQKPILQRRAAWLWGLAVTFAYSLPLSVWVSQKIPLDEHYLAWNLPRQWLHIFGLECAMLAPFLLAGGLIGLALMDRPEHIHGHYAANMMGSGAGALGAIVLMELLPLEGVLMALAALAYLAAVMLVPWPRAKAIGVMTLVGVGLFLTGWLFPPTVILSPYKKLSLELAKPGTEIIHTQFGPLGRIDVVRGPAVHDAPPGMSLLNPHPIPSRVLLLVDGDETNIIYDVEHPQAWAFLDYTTGALAYQLVEQPRTLVIGAGGGAAIGLALFHRSQQVVALQNNRQIIETMLGPLADLGGSIYRAPTVELHEQDARGFLAAASRRFDLIQLPLFDPSGTTGGSLRAAMESYLYTVQAFDMLVDHLTERGLLSVTVYTKHPPRDHLRIFDLAAQTLRRRNLEPAAHLAMIRSWETATLLLATQPWTPQALQRIRSFSQDRGFDLCYLPDLHPSETNQFHVIDQTYEVEAFQALLGPSRSEFLRQYLFAIEAPTDDRPYFNQFVRWRALPDMREQLKGTLPAFLELGSLLLLVALIQVAALASIMILAPLLPGLPALRGVSRRTITLAYFSMLGVGFMLLEIGFLQKLILYLSHPIYSAAAVIATFLVFGGLGSQWSGRWRATPQHVVTAAAAVIVALSLSYLSWLDKWLALTQSWPLGWRMANAAFTMAPLAFALGHLFPMGLRRTAEAAPALIPWAWAVNGFASVVATVSAPLLAMSIGFSRMTLIATGCYALAGGLFYHLRKK